MCNATTTGYIDMLKENYYKNLRHYADERVFWLMIMIT